MEFRDVGGRRWVVKDGGDTREMIVGSGEKRSSKKHNFMK